MNSIFAFLILGFCLSAYADAPLKTVAVRGEGEVNVRPDKAQVMLQVRTKAKEAKAAQAENAKEMARVQKVLKSEFKIDAKDIQTSSFNVNPEYRYENSGKQVFLGFIVEHGLHVNVRELSILGAIFDGVVGKGTQASSVLLQGVNFDSSKRAEFEINAMESAMKNADLRASALARFAKRSLKGVLRVSDSQVNFEPPVYEKAKMMRAREEQNETVVSPGEIVIKSNVSVEYLLE